MTDMAGGRFRLKGRELLERYGVSMYRISENGAASWPTIHKYLATPEKIELFSAEVLYGILIDGLGLTHEEAADLRLGDVFEFVSSEEDAVE